MLSKRAGPPCDNWLTAKSRGIFDQFKPKMMLPDLKQRISNAIRQSHEMDRVCHLTITGTGKLRIDGNYIILIKEDGTYHRINKQQLDQEMLRLVN